MSTRATTADQPVEENRVYFGELPTRTNVLEYSVVTPHQKVESLVAGQSSRSIIDLSCQRLTDADMANVVKYAVRDKQCKILNLWGNRFTADSMPMLVNSLYDNQTLRELDLSNNRLGDAGVEIIARFLALNKCAIKEIDLSSNDITDGGTRHLADMLASNDTVKILSLNNNDIGDEGLLRLAEGIRNGNKRLVQLRLESNPFVTPEGIRVVLHELRDNRTLQGIYVQGCTIFEPRVKEELRRESFRTGFDVYV